MCRAGTRSYDVKLMQMESKVVKWKTKRDFEVDVGR